MPSTLKHAAPLIAAFSLLLVTACNSLYQLPDPPPRDSWQRHSLSPAQDDARSAERYEAALAQLQDFIAALEGERWEDSYAMLSNETRILLDDLATEGLGETVLSTGRVEREGVEYQVDALDLFVISGYERFEDTWGDEEESETYRRKEIWAISSDGTAHRVVMILEEDTWRLHKPSIDLTPGAPGRRAADS